MAWASRPNTSSGIARTLIPARVDRLRWTPFPSAPGAGPGGVPGRQRAFRADFRPLLLLHTPPVTLGWRLGFLIVPALAVVILYMRRTLPEGPRWLIMHGRAAEAERAMSAIEALASSAGRPLPPVDQRAAIEIHPARRLPGHASGVVRRAAAAIGARRHARAVDKYDQRPVGPGGVFNPSWISVHGLALLVFGTG